MRHVVGGRFVVEAAAGEQLDPHRLEEAGVDAVGADADRLAVARAP